LLGFCGGGGGGIGTGDVPIATRVVGGGGGGIGTGDVPIATRDEGGGGGGGGGIGTGDVPIATKVVLPAAFPATMHRTETAVRTTSNASSKLRTRFFIWALRNKIVMPAVRQPDEESLSFRKKKVNTFLHKLRMQK